MSCTVWIILKISTMIVALSIPFNPNPIMHLSLPPLANILYYLTHNTVTKVTRSVKYKHAPNRWHGIKSPWTFTIIELQNENVQLFTNYNIIKFPVLYTIIRL